MKWDKKGKLFSVEDLKSDWITSHVQLPVPYRVSEDIIRIYLSARDKLQHSRPIYVDIDAKTYDVIGVHSEPLLDVGKVGMFDDSGVMFSSCVEVGTKLYMYYVGWNKHPVLPYRLAIGLAVSEDRGETFHKISEGAVMDRGFDEPFFCASPYVINEKDYFEMWYISATEWVLTRTDGYVPRYYIRHASSKDGICWKRDKGGCITYKNDQEAIARPHMIQVNGKYYMWYSYRGVEDYHDDNGYTIGLAISDDKKSWVRMDELCGIRKSDAGWDSKMLCYPAVIRNGDEYVMFYNGNEHGRYAVGYAVCTIDDFKVEEWGDV